MAKPRMRDVMKAGEDPTADRTRGQIWVPIGEWEADGTNPPANSTFGTDGRQKFNTIDFDDTTTDETFCAVPIPPDYHSGLELHIQFVINVGDTAKNTVWDADGRVHELTALADATGTGVTAVGKACDATANELLEVVLDFSALATQADVGKVFSAHLFRDHDHTAGDPAGVADDAADDAKVLATWFEYDRG